MDMGLSPNSENTKSFHRENWKVNYGNLAKWYERKIVCDALVPKHHGLWYHPWYSMATLPGTVTGIKIQIGKTHEPGPRLCLQLLLALEICANLVKPFSYLIHSFLQTRVLQGQPCHGKSVQLCCAFVATEPNVAGRPDFSLTELMSLKICGTIVGLRGFIQ
jgi:hypothetical protein